MICPSCRRPRRRGQSSSARRCEARSNGAGRSVLHLVVEHRGHHRVPASEVTVTPLRAIGSLSKSGTSNRRSTDPMTLLLGREPRRAAGSARREFEAVEHTNAALLDPVRFDSRAQIRASASRVAHRNLRVVVQRHEREVQRASGPGSGVAAHFDADHHGRVGLRALERRRKHPHRQTADLATGCSSPPRSSGMPPSLAVVAVLAACSVPYCWPCLLSRWAPRVARHTRVAPGPSVRAGSPSARCGETCRQASLEAG